MLSIQENVNLKPYNSFNLSAVARQFVIVRSVADVVDLIQSGRIQDNTSLILGGGSNILLTADVDGLVIKNEITGINIMTEDDDNVTLRVGSGENWHALVMYCVERNWGGIENLSLIPGTVGAAPMQNIGAYGVEIKDVLVSVEAIALADGALQSFDKEACRFGYRESIFKNEVKGKYFISSVTLRLTKRNHILHTDYGSIRDQLAQQHITNVTIKDVSDAVITIRRSKLPDPAVVGNAGSFFKNPTLDRAAFDALVTHYPAIPSYPAEDGRVKVPAGWLIEQCGWKGKTLDNIGVHKDQALVLVHYGGGHGLAIWQLAMRIRESVKQKFGIELTPEVNVI